MTPAPELDLAAVLAGRYTVERELGRGGMATVYLARDLKHDRQVALKVLHAELAATLGPERFRREITIAAKLQHPHILSVFDSGDTAGGQLWFTMPYVEGESLRDRLRRERQLPVADALRIAREVGAALEYAHAHGVLHRDVKPENVLLTAQGDAVLADFGIARARTASTDGTGLTETGLAVGTPQYMSPEQAAGERTIDARSDVYALGAVCYEMLAGEPPFVGSSAQAVIAKMLSTDAPSVRVLRSGVSPAIDQALHHALARAPADRWPTARAFVHALDTAERTGATAGVRGRRLPIGFGLVGFGFFVGVGVLFAWRNHESGTAPAATAGPVGLAVLPFDTDGDTTNAYIADGITDEIRGKLSALPALRLIASSSTKQYRHTHKPPEQIGRELGVRYLLTGRVEWEQGANGVKRFRVSPELVEVRTDAAPETKWQQSYDTTLADVFDVQAAVATRVADRLGVVLSPPTQAQLAVRPTQNLAAYDAYLRSLALDEFDLPTTRRALVEAERAVALDSTFAAAWARVSRLELGIAIGVADPNLTAVDTAFRAAERAIALAPTAPDGYIARGMYYWAVKQDLVVARSALETALRLAPSSIGATHGLATIEFTSGHWDRGLDYARQAAALDPRSVSSAALLGQVLTGLGRYAEADAEISRGLTIAPADFQLILARMNLRVDQGDLAGARALMGMLPSAADRAYFVALAASSLPWVLDSADRALALALPASAFGDDRETWALAQVELSWLAADTERLRRFADTLLVTVEPALKASQDSYILHLYRGLALAYLGHRGAAVREGNLGLEQVLALGDQESSIPWAHDLRAEIYVVVGDHPHAVTELDSLLAKHAPFLAASRASLTIDPRWAPLRGDPQFERLVAKH